MILTLILLPAIASLPAFVLRRDTLRRLLLVLVALAHAGLTGYAWVRPPAAMFGGWLLLDPLGLLFLSIASLLFLAAAVYGVGYLAHESHGNKKDIEENLFFSNAPEQVFTGCLLLFLSTMTLVTVSQHFGLIWMAVEATTLASSPLIYFHRHHRSLEATWKYLLICSVGIALALLGTFFLAAAARPLGSHTPIVVANLVQRAGLMNLPWLKATFLFFLVGYGTKMGLAPLHTWLPDAHSEAPSMVSALLSGALLNCAFVAILRMQQVCIAAGQAAFGQQLLLVFGLLSMAVAAVFIISQADYKRMLAYSSVEHMGILALGVGIGGMASFGAMLHAVNHSVTKAMLFFVAGNILAVYKTKATGEVRGVLRTLPITGLLWMAGFLAITGSPPFGLFLSEFTILKAAVEGGHLAVAIACSALLVVIFVGMAGVVISMAQGDAATPMPAMARRETLLSVVPPTVLGAIALLLGVYIPPVVHQAILGAAATLGGGQ
jgi:hydrogenase-4 component F